MARFFKDNGLSIVLAILFFGMIIGQSIAGWLDHRQESLLHAQSPDTYGAYLLSGDFLESVAENWESEFLQMGIFVIFTTFLFQRGSSESKDPDEEESSDEDPRTKRDDPDAPWPVRKGGAILWLYSHSLSITLFLLFIVSFGLHIVAGRKAYSEELAEHGASPIGLMVYLGSARFWFESLQNWQSEFLAILAMVVLSIYLREIGSPQSKAVADPHSKTGA